MVKMTLPFTRLSYELLLLTATVALDNSRKDILSTLGQ